MNDRCDPPASVLPAGDGGLDTSVAAAVPVGVTAGAPNADNVRPASPVLLAFSANCSCCRPAETDGGVTDAVADRPAGCCTVTGAD